MLYRTLGDRAERRLKTWLHGAHGYPQDSPVADCVRRQLESVASKGAGLDATEVEALLGDARRYRREQFSVLLTVTSVLDEMSTGGRVLREMGE